MDGKRIGIGRCDKCGMAGEQRRHVTIWPHAKEGDVPTVCRALSGDLGGIGDGGFLGSLEVASGADHTAINAAVEALARGTEEFAAARMNRGIREALAGRSIEDV